MLEHAIYDSDGQFVTGSFMDYAMPRAHDAPMIHVLSHPVPTKSNPVGAKGCGEAGTSGGLPSVANAVIDALSEYGITTPGNADDAGAHLAGDPGRQGAASVLEDGSRNGPAAPTWQPTANALDCRRRPGHSPAASWRFRLMTQTTEVLTASRPSHARLVGASVRRISCRITTLFCWHRCMPFVREDYGVSYTEIGLAFAAFNVVSAVGQTPAGFLVDRLGARALLVAGLLTGAAALIIVGLINSFWVMVAMFALAGVGNTVYHPADYALLSQHVPSDRIGQAFSVHTFAGMLGSAVAPASLLHDAKSVGLARRLHRRGGSRFCRCGDLARVVAMTRPYYRNPRRRAPAPDNAPPAGGCCCRRRSCSISFSSCCSR